MEAKVVVACDYLPDTDGLSQHRMFRVNMTLKAATDEPIETLIQADIIGSLRDMIEERTAEVIGWSTKDPMAITDGEAQSHGVSTQLTISSCRRADCENPDTPFVSKHHVEGVMISRH
jgi:hypothetical protein